MSERNSRRTLIGIVTSDKMEKTITVSVVRTFQHPKYKKFVRQRAKFHVHDEDGQAHMGDRVEITECRPMSKLKCWRLTKVIEQAVVTAPALAENPEAEGGAE